MKKSFLRDTSGQDLVEYALLLALVALGSVAALSALSGIITDAWVAISAKLST